MPSTYQGKPFAEWTLSDAKAAIEDAIPDRAAYDANKAYVEDGDHWQDGDAWPIRHADAEIDAQILAAVEPMFVSVDLVEEAVSRQVDALLDKQPAIIIAPREPAGEDGKPSDQQTEQANGMRELLNAWWDEVDFWEKIRAASARTAWATRGPLRLRYLPASIVDGQERDPESGEVRTRPVLRRDLPFEDALALVYLSAPSPDVALLYTDEETQEKAALILLTDEQGKEYAEVWHREGEGVVRRIVGKGAGEAFPIPGGSLPLEEMRGRLLVTDSVRRQQARADFFETLLSRTAETAGFRDRFISNAEPNYAWSTTPPSDGPALVTETDSRGVTWYGHSMPRILGAGMVQELQGRPVPVGDGNREGLSSIGVTIADPVDPDYIIKSCKHARATLLENCHQGHVLEADKATSGYSKRQGRADFEKHVRSYRSSVELAIMGILEGAISAALLMTTEGDEWRGFLEEYRITVTLSIDTGPLSAEEMESEMRAAERLFKPRADVQAAIGVDDGESADAAILSDPIQSLAAMKLRGELVAVWQAVNIAAALIAAGVDPESDLGKAAARSDFPEGQ